PSKNATWYDIVPTCGTASHYRLRVILKPATQSCTTALTGAPPNDGINGFKVRSTCSLNSLDHDFSMGAADSNAGPFDAASGGPVVATLDTAYEIAGTMPYSVDVTGTAANGRFQLPNAD